MKFVLLRWGSNNNADQCRLALKSFGLLTYLMII